MSERTGVLMASKCRNWKKKSCHKAKYTNIMSVYKTVLVHMCCYGSCIVHFLFAYDLDSCRNPKERQNLHVPKFQTNTLPGQNKTSNVLKINPSPQKLIIIPKEAKKKKRLKVRKVMSSHSVGSFCSSSQGTTRRERRAEKGDVREGVGRVFPV